MKRPNLSKFSSPKFIWKKNHSKTTGNSGFFGRKCNVLDKLFFQNVKILKQLLVTLARVQQKCLSFLFRREEKKQSLPQEKKIRKKANTG